MRIAITMPTGKVGKKLVNELLDRGGHELTLLTTDPSKVRKAAVRGAKAVQGRLEDSTFVFRATEGVDALFFVLPINSHQDDVFRDTTRILASVCNAIKKNSIPRVVFISSIGTHLDKATGPINVLRDAEQMLSEYAPNLTVLRPVFYMDQLMGWMHDIAEDGALYSPLSDKTSIPLIATRDVAEVAADVLTDPTWTGSRTLSLHGPRSYTYSEIADVMSKTLSLNVRHVQIKPTEMADKLRRRGWSDEAVKANIDMLAALKRGDITDELPRSEWKFQRTTLEEFVAQELEPAFEEVAAIGV